MLATSKTVLGKRKVDGAGEIEIYNSEGKRIGAVQVHVDSTAAEFWEEVRVCICL